MFEKEAEDNKPPYAFCAFNTKCELWKSGFQQGAEFGYNKGLAEGSKEFKEKISILLSCKNCPENKGGFICVKEYEDKCLAQKIEFIKELKKENAELKDKLEILIAVGNTCTKGLNKQLSKSKELITKLMHEFYYLCELHNFSVDYECLAEAEQFLNCEVEKTIESSEQKKEIDLNPDIFRVGGEND